jgi:RNA polymerase sigma-70 factor (ECF subfamily)
MRSWEEFYGLYRELVYGFARRSGLSHEEALEATEEVFIRAAIAIQEFDRGYGKGSFRGWLMKLTNARVSEKLRDRSRASRGIRSEPAPAKDRERRGANSLGKLFGVLNWAGRRFS